MVVAAARNVPCAAPRRWARPGRRPGPAWRRRPPGRRGSCGARRQRRPWCALAWHGRGISGGRRRLQPALKDDAGAGGHWRLGQPARQVGEQPAVGVVAGDAPQVPHGAALPAAPPGSGRFPPRAAHRGGDRYSGPAQGTGSRRNINETRKERKGNLEGALKKSWKEKTRKMYEIRLTAAPVQPPGT